MVHLLGLGLFSLLYCLALLSLGRVLACTSIYRNVNYFGLLKIAHFLTSLKQLNLQVVVWSCWGLLFGDLLEVFLSTKLKKKLAELEDPQLHLLRSCLSVCKITHLLQCVLSSSLGCFPYLFDSNLRNCLSRIMWCSISDNAWLEATLPFSLGGLGLHKSQHSSHPAFLGSCNSAWTLVSHLVPNFDVTSSFPGERLPCLILKIFPSRFLNYPLKMTYRLPLMVSYLPMFLALQQFGTKPIYVLFRYQQWVAEGHPSTISRLGLFSS